MLLQSLFISLIHVAAIASAAYTPRSHNIQKRHAALLHARAPVPASVPVKKRDSKKCRPRPAPSSSLVAPVNPAADPTPTTSKQQQPADPTTTTAQQKPTSKPPSSGGGGSGGSSGGGSDPFGNFFAGTQTGQLTFYELGLTACGSTPTDSDMVAAASEHLFDAVPGANGNPNDNPICGKQVQIEFEGHTIVVSIQDRCVACASTDLDLSPSAFSQLASQSRGRVSGAQWHFV